MPTPSESPRRSGSGGATRDGLLDAAESLFAERGIARTSVRAITQAAKANLASVHYHFGSKEGLMKAVFARRLRPLNRERLDLLDRCLAEADPPELERVVYAFVSPVLHMMRRDGPGLQQFATIIGRAFSQPGDLFRKVLLDEFQEVIQHFGDALRRARPELQPADLFWRFHFMVGAMAHTASAGFLVGELSGGACDPEDVDGLTRRLVDFLVSGWEAPGTEPPP